jgi:hypothetical protein
MERDCLWLRQARGRGEAVWPIEVLRRVPLDRYPDTYDWLITVLPCVAPSLCDDDHGLVLRPRVDDLSRHPAEVADTDDEVVLWTIPGDVFVDLKERRRDVLGLRDYVHPVGGGETFYLASERGLTA